MPLLGASTPRRPIGILGGLTSLAAFAISEKAGTDMMIRFCSLNVRRRGGMGCKGKKMFPGNSDGCMAVEKCWEKSVRSAARRTRNFLGRDDWQLGSEFIHTQASN